MQSKMYLSETDAKLGGVCGGISEFFGFNSNALRIVFVIATCLTGGNVILLYLALLFLMPKRNTYNL